MYHCQRFQAGHGENAIRIALDDHIALAGGLYLAASAAGSERARHAIAYLNVSGGRRRGKWTH
jgi:hypothetical protein